MYDYVGIVHSIIDTLVDNPEELLVRITDQGEIEDLRDVHVLVACSNSSLGRLIGRHGNIADAIRTLVNVRARDNHQRVHVKFEAFSKEEN